MRKQDFGLAFETMVSRSCYVFHVHTDFTDGKSSVEDYCKYALSEGFDSIIFLEHVRRKCEYRFADLLSAVGAARKRYPQLTVWLGVEARLLPGGLLDVSDDILEKVDILGIACHSFPQEPEAYADSMCNAFREYRGRCPVLVWVHPGTFYSCRLGRMDEDGYWSIVEQAVAHGVYIEDNLKHPLPSALVWMEEGTVRAVVGTDAHSVEELQALAPQLRRKLRRGILEES